MVQTFLEEKQSSYPAIAVLQMNDFLSSEGRLIKGNLHFGIQIGSFAGISISKMVSETGTSVASAKSIAETGTVESGAVEVRTAEAVLFKGSAKEIAEKVVHVHIAIAAVEMELTVSVSIILAVAIVAGSAFTEGRMTELVVHFPFLLIA